MNVHGNADSHIDALCHVIYDGSSTTESPRTPSPATAPPSCPSWPPTGSSAAGCCSTSPVSRGGLAGARRPRDRRRPARRRAGRGRPRRPGRPPARAGRAPPAAETSSGHGTPPRSRRTSPGPRCRWSPSGDRGLGSDGNNDTAPSTTDGVDFPVHVLAINAMGLHLLDYLQFEDLVPLCEEPAAGHSCASSRRCAWTDAGPGHRSTRSSCCDHSCARGREAVTGPTDGHDAEPQVGLLSPTGSLLRP